MPAQKSRRSGQARQVKGIGRACFEALLKILSDDSRSPFQLLFVFSWAPVLRLLAHPPLEQFRMICPGKNIWHAKLRGAEELKQKGLKNLVLAAPRLKGKAPMRGMSGNRRAARAGAPPDG